MKRPFAWIRVAVLAVGLIAPACGGGGGGGTPPVSCTTVAECAAGQICAANVCNACAASAQCLADYGAGATCEAGVCTPATCPAGDEGCPCKPDGTCTVGECVDDVCEVPTCPAGELTCPCTPEGACTAGQCIAGTCVDCARGTLDCLCYANQTCNAGLRCRADGLCETCPAGAEGCPCDEGGLCGAGLVCESDLCVPDPCPAGSENCPCKPDDVCDGELHCGPAGLCMVCSNDIEGCPCVDDACENDLVCDAAETVCRAPRSCTEAACVPHQVCETAPGADAVCATRCDAGFVWNEASGVCDEVINPNCTVEAAGSILAQCEAAHRVCEATGDTAACGACAAGYTDEGGRRAECRALVTCAGLGCAEAHRACTEATATDDAVCSACLPGFIGDGATPEGCRAVQTCAELDCAAQNRACTAETATSDAVCGACLLGFVLAEAPETGCRAVHTCADLDCASQNRACTAETETGDAVCGDCLPGFQEDGGLCVEPPEPNCTVGAPGSIAAECEAAHRNCVDPDDGPAHCEGCVEGFAENAAGDCQEIRTCDDLGCAALHRLCVGEAPFQSCGACFEGTTPDPTNPEACIAPLTCAEITCPDDEFCVEAEGESAHCQPSTCPALQAYSEFSGGCVDCVVNCGDDAGETGRLWPYTLAGSDRCICETADGYYWDEGLNRGAKPCDADGDGWVRNAARSYLESDDNALLQNARCALRTIDRFVLENELGQRLAVLLCEGDTPWLREDLGPCDLMAPLHLYESVRNDDQDELEASTLAPPYRQSVADTLVGRHFRAGEINPLTRACTEAGDFNDNGLSDIREWSGMPPGELSAENATFAEFGYYLELHQGFYEGGTESLVGQYVIRERSRCESAIFPLHYGPTAAPYWRECTRSRDAAFDPRDGTASPEFGLDFARWSCDAEAGTCPVPPPPTEAPPGVAPPEHGLCQVALPPADRECDEPAEDWLCIDNPDGSRGVWRGMSHHSQFRCVQIDPDPSTEVPTLAPSEFEPAAGAYLFETCHVACPAGDEECALDCAAPGACTTSTQAPAAGPNPWSPLVACELEDPPAEGDVGFAVVKYVGSGVYQRGCIDEWAPTAISGDPNGSEDGEIIPWRSLCPGWALDPDSTIGQGNQFAFGELQCGCGNNYGGPSCNVGCPDPQLHLSPGYVATPRQGYWMCGDFAASGYETEDPEWGPAMTGADPVGGQFVLRATVPTSMGGGQPLCENPELCTCPVGETCATGFVVR